MWPATRQRPDDGSTEQAGDCVGAATGRVPLHTGDWSSEDKSVSSGIQSGSRIGFEFMGLSANERSALETLHPTQAVR